MESKMKHSIGMFPRRAALSFALVLCTAFASSNSVAAVPATGVKAVDITGFAFSPQEITVAPGTTVRWINRDPTQHTVTSDTKLFDSKPLATGAQFEYTFTTAGDFSYHCSIHAFMTGIVHVVK
jgi:plastocyanin